MAILLVIDVQHLSARSCCGAVGVDSTQDIQFVTQDTHAQDGPSGIRFDLFSSLSVQYRRPRGAIDRLHQEPLLTIGVVGAKNT